MVEIDQSPTVVGGGARVRSTPYVGNVDIYYERKLKEIFLLAADNAEGLLYNVQEWNYFIALTLKARLVTIRDTERLEKVRPSFPLNFETFVNTVQQEFGDQSLKHLDKNLDEAKE